MDMDNDDHYIETRGEFGEFYTSPLKVERTSSNSSHIEQRSVYGCPNCNRMFIGVYH